MNTSCSSNGEILVFGGVKTLESSEISDDLFLIETIGGELSIFELILRVLKRQACGD